MESSIRDAFFRDYQCVMVEDCCKSHNDEAHLAMIKNIIYAFGMVLNSDEVVNALT